MSRAMTTVERASRERVMLELRSWMEARDIPRTEVADHFGITVGHLSTLINANRTPSEAQVDEAIRYMGKDVSPCPSPPPLPPASKPKPKQRPVPRIRKSSRRVRQLRPLSKDEAQFVRRVAESWIKNNQNASQEEFVDVVRALSIGIRS